MFFLKFNNAQVQERSRLKWLISISPSTCEGREKRRFSYFKLSLGKGNDPSRIEYLGAQSTFRTLTLSLKRGFFCNIKMTEPGFRDGAKNISSHFGLNSRVIWKRLIK